jgi:hypothetical protein
MPPVALGIRVPQDMKKVRERSRAEGSRLVGWNSMIPMAPDELAHSYTELVIDRRRRGNIDRKSRLGNTALGISRSPNNLMATSA